MKTKTLVILVVICIGLGAVTWWVSTAGRTPQSAVELGSPLLPDLPINDVTAIELQDSEGSLHLQKGEAVWQVADRYQYPADFKKIVDLAKKIKDMKIGRSFEASAETQKRLALIPPGKDTAGAETSGTRVILSNSKGDVLADLIIGKRRESEAGSGGHYIKLADDDTAYLVDQNFAYMDKKPADWLKKDLIDVKPDDIRKVSCLDAKGNAIYELERPEKGKPPVFIDPPSGKEVDSGKLNDAFRALSVLRIEDVADPAEKVFEPGKKLIYRLFDGTVYTVYPGPAAAGQEETHYIKIETAFEAPAKDASKEDDAKAPKAEETKTDETAEPKKPEAPEKTPQELAHDAEVHNAELSPWTYMIGKWKFENFITAPEDLYKSEKTD